MRMSGARSSPILDAFRQPAIDGPGALDSPSWRWPERGSDRAQLSSRSSPLTEAGGGSGARSGQSTLRRVSPVAPDPASIAASQKLLGSSVAAKLAAMKFLDPQTERAVRSFLARVPADVRLDHAILYGSRARGEHRPDSDADVALIIAEGAADWQLVGTLADLAYEVFLESGILIQPVPVSLTHWRHPDGFPRPGFLRNVAREGIVL